MSASAKEAEQERALRQKIRSSLLAWSIHALAEQGYTPAAHHRALIAALEGLANGESGRLMVLLPPGSAKSTYTSLLFPAWWMARHPERSVIAASHTASLAAHFGRGVRRLIDTYSAQLGLKIRADERAALAFATTRGGSYFGVGTQGAVTGRRADLAVIDDPIRSLTDAESLESRERLWNWFRSELMTRLKPRAAVVLAMTRWHYDDLAARLLQAGGWQSLVLPALAEAGDVLGRDIGEALWPEWEDAAGLLAKRETLGERHFSALFQQAPHREMGRTFDPRLIATIDRVDDAARVRAWDLAAGVSVDGDHDWTVGLRLAQERNGRFIVEDVYRVRVAPAELAAVIRRIAECDGLDVPIGLPRDPGQAGLHQATILTRELAGFVVQSSPECGSKGLRARAVASQVSAGNMRMLIGAWNRDFLDELAAFPDGKKDDQVDALSRAFHMLTQDRKPARFASLPFLAR